MELSARTAALSPEQQTQDLPRDYLALHRELYTPEVIPAPSTRRRSSAMAALATHPEWRAFDAAFGCRCKAQPRAPRRVPDFRCDFPSM